MAGSSPAMTESVREATNRNVTRAIVAALRRRAREPTRAAAEEAAASFAERKRRSNPEAESRVSSCPGWLPPDFAFPTRLAEGLADASPGDLAEIEVSPAGLGLHWPKLDADVYVPALLQGVFGSKRWMAAELGAAGGKARSRNQGRRSPGKRPQGRTPAQGGQDGAPRRRRSHQANLPIEWFESDAWRPARSAIMSKGRHRPSFDIRMQTGARPLFHT